jgi:hypothetical protein
MCENQQHTGSAEYGLNGESVTKQHGLVLAGLSAQRFVALGESKSIRCFVFPSKPVDEAKALLPNGSPADCMPPWAYLANSV